MQAGEIVFNDWIVGECIGKGGFGEVYKITKENFGHTYQAALKVIEISQSQKKKYLIYLMIFQMRRKLGSICGKIWKGW